MHRAKAPTFGYSGKHARTSGIGKYFRTGEHRPGPTKKPVASLLSPVRAGLLGQSRPGYRRTGGPDAIMPVRHRRSGKTSGFLTRGFTRSDVWEYNAPPARKPDRQPEFMSAVAIGTRLTSSYRSKGRRPFAGIFGSIT